MLKVADKAQLFRDLMILGFITGSRRWGVQGTASDLDIVVAEADWKMCVESYGLVEKDDIIRGGSEPQDIDTKGQDPLGVYLDRFESFRSDLGQDVNIIVTKPVQYKAWAYATAHVDKYCDPVGPGITSKETRVDIFTRAKREYLNSLSACAPGKAV